jgi:hypothetical protein
MFYDMSTLDIKSQSLEIKDYAVPTGFILNRFYLDKSAPNHGAAALPERCHHLIMTKAMRKRGTGRLFIPPELEEYANRIYAGFEGIAVNGETQAPIDDTPKLFTYPEHSYAECVEALPETLPEVASINFWLNMALPSCGERYEQAKAKGFRFTGFQMLCGNGEYILLNRSGDFEKALGEANILPEFEWMRDVVRSL